MIFLRALKLKLKNKQLYRYQAQINNKLDLSLQKLKHIEKLNLIKVKEYVKKDNMSLKKKERKNNETKYKH
jgi:hypothetical protein